MTDEDPGNGTAADTTDDVLANGRRLVASGRYRAAIDELSAHNRRAAEPRIEEELVRIRHRAAHELVDNATAPPDLEPISAAETRPLSEITVSELSVDVLRDGLAHQGYVLVRGLLDKGHAAKWRSRIDRALGAFDEGLAGAPPAQTTPWYKPFRPEGDDYRIGGRKWMRQSGGVWSVDSPHLLFELCDVIEETGITQLVTDYLGERPMLSANKCNLRRSPVKTSTDWHQDGAFLGRDVRSLNLWLALGECGVEAPGLDMVPRRLDDLATSGTEGAWFEWSVAPDVVDEVADGIEIIRPEFGPGDALLFDHLFLHRTGISETMTLDRHAIETWFFAPSCYPEGQIPILL